MKLLDAKSANELYGELTGRPYHKPYSLFEAMRRRGQKVGTTKLGPYTVQAVTEEQVRAFVKSKKATPVLNRRPARVQNITITTNPPPPSVRRGRKKSAWKRARTVAENGRYEAEQKDGYVYLRRVVDCPALFDDEDFTFTG